MQTLPAGIAIFIAQVCFGLVMLGIHRSSRADRCTGIWGLGMLIVGAGMLIATENAGQSNVPKLLIGNLSIIVGGTFYWWGTQAFYRQMAITRLGAPSRNGWLVAAGFSIGYVAVVASGASPNQRALLMSLFAVTIMGLVLYEVLRGHRGWHTLGSSVAMIGTLVLILGYFARTVALLATGASGATGTLTVLEAIVVYFTPLAGLMLSGAGLMLMYFERIVAENRRLASEDALTGLQNRGAITAMGERALVMALAKHRPLTVALLDVDFFKNINDSFGHDVGDQVLTGLARLLKTHCREQDLIGRYGGEEFCILFPDMDEEDSAGAAKRILEAARAYRFYDGQRLTVSIGMATLRRGAVAEVSWTALIKAADQQLYLAKESGRDQWRGQRFTAAPATHGAAAIAG